MKIPFVVAIILFITQIGLCQKDISIRNRNHLGFQIKIINSKYVILDSLGNRARKETFDYVTLESINSWGKERNSFVCKKQDKSYLISADCQTIMKFDSINILSNGSYICISDNAYSLINDDFEILHEDLLFLGPLIRMPGEFIFKKSTFCGILDEEEILIEMDVDSLIDIYSWKYIGIVSNKKMGIFDYDKGKVLLKPKYDYIVESHIHSENEKQRFLIFNDGKFNLINKRGKTLADYSFECITTWVEYGPDGHYICNNDKIGIIDYNGKEIIPPIYEELFYCTSGIYKAVKDNKFGVVDNKNKTIVPFIYNSIIIDDFRINSNEKMYIYGLEDKTWKKIDFSGKIVNGNCNNCEFIKNLAPYQINHYGFEYVRGLMISKEHLLEKIK